MTTGPRNREHIRVSDADRERAVDFLKTAFVQSRLSKDEFSLRIGLALTSRTYGELTATTAGIPARPPYTHQHTLPQTPPRPAAPARRPSGKKIAGWSACAVLTPALAAAFFTPYGGIVVLMVLAFAGATLVSGPSTAFKKDPFS